MNFPCKALWMEPAHGHGNNANVMGGRSQLGATTDHPRAWGGDPGPWGLLSPPAVCGRLQDLGLRQGSSHRSLV